MSNRGFPDNYEQLWDFERLIPLVERYQDVEKLPDSVLLSYCLDPFQFYCLKYIITHDLDLAIEKMKNLVNESDVYPVPFVEQNWFDQIMFFFLKTFNNIRIFLSKHIWGKVKTRLPEMPKNHYAVIIQDKSLDVNIRLQILKLKFIEIFVTGCRYNFKRNLSRYLNCNRNLFVKIFRFIRAGLTNEERLSNSEKKSINRLFVILAHCVYKLVIEQLLVIEDDEIKMPSFAHLKTSSKTERQHKIAWFYRLYVCYYCWAFAELGTRIAHLLISYRLKNSLDPYRT